MEDYKRLGRKCFTKEILEYVEDDDNRTIVNEREKYWIAKLHANVDGYNVNPGGVNTFLPETLRKCVETKQLHGYRPSAETKRKISEANKDKAKSDEHKQHLSEHHRTHQARTIEFENGASSIQTEDAICKIATQYGISPATLRRRSSKGLYTGGIRIAELLGNSYRLKGSMQQARFKDPVEGDVCTYRALYLRMHRYADKYKGIEMSKCRIAED